MALQSNAALLDELMGKNRNVAPGANVSQTRYDDDDVCKHFLVAFCPHELFVNTRADLGPCTKSHDEALKLKYQQSTKYGRLGYEDDFERFLRGLLGEVERKIKRGQERLKLTQPSDSSGKTALQVKRERLAVVKEEINKLIKQAEELGEQGCIEEAQNVIQECDKFKSECKYLENQIDLATGNNPDGKQMEVCDVCGSFLIINDSSSRIEEHNNGKQHQGYAKLRAALEELRKKRMEELEKREKEREARDKDRDNERRRSKSRDRHTRRSSRDRDGRRGSSRDRRKNSRSPVSSRRRSRSRDRERGSDRLDSHRSHRDHKRTRSRSRSRDRKHSSRNNNRGSEEKNGSSSNGVDKSHSKSHNHSSSNDSESKRSSKSRKLDQEADEFMKLADDITNGGTKRSEESKNGSTNGEKVKKPKKNRTEEKEEGEEDDEDWDE